MYSGSYVLKTVSPNIFDVEMLCKLLIFVEDEEVFLQLRHKPVDSK